MAIEFECGCGRQLRAADEYAGRRAKCPECGWVHVVPSPPEDEARSPSGTHTGVVEGNGAGGECEVHTDIAAISEWLGLEPDPSPTNETRTAPRETRDRHVPNATARGARRSEEEPWCYGFLEAYAAHVRQLGLILFVAGLVILGVFCLGAMASEVMRSELPFRSLGVFAVGALALYLIKLPLDLTAATILLAVDAGRSLREMRRLLPSYAHA